MFERPDWTVFRSLGTLGQKVGVPVGAWRRSSSRSLPTTPWTLALLRRSFAMAAAHEKTKALDLDQIVRRGLETTPEHRWDRPLGSAAADVAAGVLNS